MNQATQKQQSPIGKYVSFRHANHTHLNTPPSPPHIVTGQTTTGVYVTPRDSVTDTDIELAKRGVLPRASEWIPSKLVTIW